MEAHANLPRLAVPAAVPPAGGAVLAAVPQVNSNGVGVLPPRPVNQLAEQQHQYDLLLVQLWSDIKLAVARIVAFISVAMFFSSMLCITAIVFGISGYVAAKIKLF